MKEIYYHSVREEYGDILSEQEPRVSSENGAKYYVVIDIIGTKYQFPIEQTMFKIKEWKYSGDIKDVPWRYGNAIKELMGTPTGVAIKNKK